MNKADKPYLPYPAQGDGDAAVIIGTGDTSGAAQDAQADTQSPMQDSITRTKAFSDALARARSKDKAEIESLKVQNEQISSILAHLGLPEDPHEAAAMLVVADMLGAQNTQNARGMQSAQSKHGAQSTPLEYADAWGNSPFDMGCSSYDGTDSQLENDLRTLGHIDAHAAIAEGAHEELIRHLLAKPFPVRNMRDQACYDVLSKHKSLQDQMAQLRGMGVDVDSLSEDPVFSELMGKLSDSLTMPQKWEFYQQYVVPAGKPSSKTPPPSVRSASQPKGDYFSEDQVDNMSRNEVLANLDAINASMARWNRRHR